MKAKILMDDSGRETFRPPGWIPRWDVGEIGVVLENDFPEKYDYKVKLPGFNYISDLFGHGPVNAVRVYYFYKGEVELVSIKQVWYNDDNMMDIEKIPIEIETLDKYLKSKTNRRTKTFMIIPRDY